MPNSSNSSYIEKNDEVGENGIKIKVKMKKRCTKCKIGPIGQNRVGTPAGQTTRIRPPVGRALELGGPAGRTPYSPPNFFLSLSPSTSSLKPLPPFSRLFLNVLIVILVASFEKDVDRPL